MPRFRYALGVIAVCALVLSVVLPSRADLPVITNSGALGVAGDTVVVSNLAGQSTCAISEVGTPGPIDAEGSNDNQHWTPVSITDYSYPPSLVAQPVTPASGTSYVVPATSLRYVRLRADATWSGQSATAYITCSSSVARVGGSGGGGGSGVTSITAASGPLQISPNTGVVTASCPTCVYTQNTASPIPQPTGNVALNGGAYVTGNLVAGYSSGNVPAAVATGDGVFVEGAKAGRIWLCGNGAPHCAIDFGVKAWSGEGTGTDRVTVHGHLRVLSDIDTYGGSFNLNPLNAIPTPTLSFVAGGTQPQTTYFVRVTGTTFSGEGYDGNASAEQSITVPANNVLVVTTQINPGYSPLLDSIYVSTVSGNYSTGLQASSVTPGSAWTEPVTGLVVGAALPSVDNSAGYILSTRFGNNMPICSGIPSPAPNTVFPGDYFLSNLCTSTTPTYQNLSLPSAGGFQAGDYIGLGTDPNNTGRTILVDVPATPCPSTGCGVVGVGAVAPILSSGGTTPVISLATSAPTCTGNITCSGSYPFTYSVSTPCPSAGSNVTVTGPWPCTIAATVPTTHVKLAIGLGFSVGTVSTATTYPYQPVVAYTNGQITGLRAACGAADNGTTVASLQKNGVQVATLTLASGSQGSSTTFAPIGIAAGDILHVVVTTAGTAANCGFIAEGQQDAY